MVLFPERYLILCRYLIFFQKDKSNYKGEASWQSHFSALRSTLESGVPTMRSQFGAHGQGSQIVEAPQHIAGYLLHLTATTILFLVESEKQMI